MSNDIQLMQRSLERERLSRKKAEGLLEMREAELLDRHHELTTVVGIMRGQLEMLEGAVNAISKAIVTLEVDGTIRLFNRHAQKLFGLASEEVLGTSFRSLMPQIFSRENAQRLRDDILLGQVTKIAAAIGRRRDGSEIRIDVQCTSSVRKEIRRVTLVIERHSKERRKQQSTFEGPAPAVPTQSSEELIKFLSHYEKLRSQKNAGASADLIMKQIDGMIGDLISSRFSDGIPEELKHHSLPGRTSIAEKEAAAPGEKSAKTEPKKQIPSPDKADPANSAKPAPPARGNAAPPVRKPAQRQNGTPPEQVASTESKVSPSDQPATNDRNQQANAAPQAEQSAPAVAKPANTEIREPAANEPTSTEPTASSNAHSESKEAQPVEANPETSADTTTDESASSEPATAPPVTPSPLESPVAEPQAAESQAAEAQGARPANADSTASESGQAEQSAHEIAPSDPHAEEAVSDSAAADSPATQEFETPMAPETPVAEATAPEPEANQQPPVKVEASSVEVDSPPVKVEASLPPMDQPVATEPNVPEEPPQVQEPQHEPANAALASGAIAAAARQLATPMLPSPQPAPAPTSNEAANESKISVAQPPAKSAPQTEGTPPVTEAEKTETTGEEQPATVGESNHATDVHPETQPQSEIQPVVQPQTESQEAPNVAEEESVAEATNQAGEESSPLEPAQPNPEQPVYEQSVEAASDPQSPASSESVHEVNQTAKRVVANNQFAQRAVRKKAEVNLLLEGAIEGTRQHWSEFADLITDFGADIPGLDWDRNNLRDTFAKLIHLSVEGVKASGQHDTDTRGKIQITSKNGDGSTRIEIEDDGIGLMSIFTNSLAIGKEEKPVAVSQWFTECQQELANAGGQLSIRTAPNDGTTFEITLPQ